VPYQVPLSIGAVQRVFRLPYGKPYFLALGIKLLAYAAMIGATIPLIARARRRASLWTGASNPMADSPLEPQASDPWEPRDQALVTTAAARPAGVAGYSRPPVADRPEDAARTLRAGPGRSESRDPAGGPLPLMVFATGGTVIVLAVTLLKYLHVLSEAIRAR
jgi:hypothetical protein